MLRLTRPRMLLPTPAGVPCVLVLSTLVRPVVSSDWPKPNRLRGIETAQHTAAMG